MRSRSAFLPQIEEKDPVFLFGVRKERAKTRSILKLAGFTSRLAIGSYVGTVDENHYFLNS